MSRRRLRDADANGLFAVACPRCGAEAAVKASRAGSAARCPGCRGLFLVPDPGLTPRPTAAAAAVDPPPAAAHEPLPTLAAPPPPPGMAAAAPVTTPFDDLELLAAAGSSALALQEPARTIEADGRVIELRRVSDEERRRRKTWRTIVTLLVGSGILAGLAWFLGR